MPSHHLGKLYASELVFTGAYAESIALVKTQNPADLVNISTAVANAFRSMNTMRSRMMRTLLDSSVGVILITTKL